MSSNLPERPSLEHLKKQARARLRQLQVHAPGTRLADAQHAIARECGFASWPKLKAHVDAVTGAPERAVAVRLRDTREGGSFGMAVFVPSKRYAALLIDGTNEPQHRKLTRAVWREIDDWLVAGDSGLPAEPAPLSRSVVAALLQTERPAISAYRVASFSVSRKAVISR